MYLYALLSAFGMGVVAVLAALALTAQPGSKLLDFNRLKTAAKPIPIALATVFVVLAPWGISTLAIDSGKADVIGGYKQYLNGALVSANSDVTTCTRDGSCQNEYQCDPYWVTETYFTTDSKGNTTSHTRLVEKWHDCPYVTKEYSYWVTRSFGFKTEDVSIASHIFAANPVSWRSSHGIPGDVPRGVPAEWLKYRNDIAKGDADPVTEVGTYVNYVLASQDNTLKAFSDQIDQYLKSGLLPEHTAGALKNKSIIGRWDAAKMSFVGFTPANAQIWQNRLMRFNAALGMTLQGDMHIVAVPSNVVSSGDSEGYINALKAYWQGPKFGKKALAKNGIIVVMGVNTASNTIDWARSQTGMPIGNGEMTSAIEMQLPGKPFDPDTILGKIQAKVVAGDKRALKIEYQHGTSLLDHIVFTQFPFARACMSCKNKNEVGRSSFTYLEADVKMPSTAYVLDIMLSLVSGGIAGLILVFGSGLAANPRSPLTRNPRPY